MKNLAICLLLLLGAVGCGDDYVVYETVDTMVCIPKNDFQVLEYDAASGQACVYDLYLYKGGYNDDGITVKLVVDPSVLDVYNVESGLELKVMPDRYFAFDPEVRLSGDRVMDRAEIRFDAASMLADGIDSSYVLPLSVRADDQRRVRPEKEQRNHPGRDEITVMRRRSGLSASSMQKNVKILHAASSVCLAALVLAACSLLGVAAVTTARPPDRFPIRPE